MFIHNCSVQQFRIAKTRDGMSKDLTHTKQMKDKQEMEIQENKLRRKQIILSSYLTKRIHSLSLRKDSQISVMAGICKENIFDCIKKKSNDEKAAGPDEILDEA